MRASPTLLSIRQTTTTTPPLRTTLSTPCFRLTAVPPPRQQRRRARPFSTPSSSSPATQSIHASRIVPYSATALYAIIADVAAYSAFLPYCSSSQVDATLAEAPHHPTRATLTVGYLGLTHSFTSRILCVPALAVVEALAGGAARTTLPPDVLAPFLPPSAAKTPSPADPASLIRAPDNDVFRALRARWTLKEFPFKPNPPHGRPPQEGDAEAHAAQPRTEVSLTVEAEFKSGVFGALSQAASGKVADVMVGAFEERARTVLGHSGGEGVQGGVVHTGAGGAERKANVGV